MPADHLRDLRCHELGCVAIRFGQQDRELVAAEPREHVGRAAALLQARAQTAQQLVTDTVTEPVVDGLEPVEIDHQHRCVLAEPAMTVDLTHELLLEAMAIEQTGQQVVVHEIAQAAFKRAPLGDVLKLVGQRHRRYGAVARCRQCNPEGGAVRPEQPDRRLV